MVDLSCLRPIHPRRCPLRRHLGVVCQLIWYTLASVVDPVSISWTRQRIDHDLLCGLARSNAAVTDPFVCWLMSDGWQSKCHTRESESERIANRRSPKFSFFLFDRLLYVVALQRTQSAGKTKRRESCFMSKQADPLVHV